MTDRDHIVDSFKSLQDHICSNLERLDGHGQFKEDPWMRPGGGGGRTRIIQGQRIEKGGVNFSAVHGPMPERITNALGIEPTSFFATGVSIVLHPVNPHVPIIHMNVRYFETESGLWWFGGGIDMTPHYVVEGDARIFHTTLKEVCDKHNERYYPEFKKWADDYFYIKHRKETRGIGGIFFDRLNADKGEKSELFKFVMDVGYAFIPCYEAPFEKHKDDAVTERDKHWQFNRRGRYAEFNLVWDKGTKFGLDTDGNIESILMSLPPQVEWTYKYPYNEKERQTLALLRKEIDWVNYKEA